MQPIVLYAVNDILVQVSPNQTNIISGIGKKLGKRTAHNACPEYDNIGHI
jgi:hypothetical protein